ncbi:MAG: winged helix DNA-binding domain-containing protein, partial [Chloroflexota bacterium]|nr:winged helix DNA-binding domain-containing protein [Chloroflexota bacterium]
DNASLAEAAAADNLPLTLTTFLSPFDPLVWDRARGKAMFDFDYRIECYTPEANRRYGYFTLPILRRGLLIGRLDAKAHRKEGLFEVRALHLEPEVKPDAALIEDVAGALLECAAWHKTPEVVVRRSDPPHLAAALADATKTRAA